MKPKNWTEEEKQALALKNTNFNIIDSISRCLPKLKKQQLLEIMLLSNAWRNNIPLSNPERVAIGTQALTGEIKSLQLLNLDLEQKVRELTEELMLVKGSKTKQDETLKKVIAENRVLKNQVFMQTGVRN